ncbi:GAF domain-containing protein [Spirosoma aerophilum]
METTFTLPRLDKLLLHFRLSFKPFVRFLKEQQTLVATEGLTDLYAYLIDQFTSAVVQEDTREPVDEARLKHLFQLATMAVLPLNHTRREISYAFGIPVPLTLFHYSPAFEQLIQQHPDFLIDLPDQITQLDRQQLAYQMILEKCYAVKLDHSVGQSFQFQKRLNGVTKFYRLDINNSFVQPQAGLMLPPLKRIWVDFAKGQGPLPVGEEALLLDQFTFEGFAFFQLEDVTEAETVRQLQDVFVHLHSDTEPMIYHRFESALRNLCGQADAQIGIIPMPQVNGHFVYPPNSKSRSIFFQYAGASDMDYKDPMAQKMVRKIAGSAVPYLFPDLAGLPDPVQTALIGKGIRSFLLYPVVSGTDVLGILEMGSPHPFALNEEVLTKIENILPLIQELLRYQLNQFNNNLEQLIRKKFTSLQPAVEWKFYEAAWAYLNQEQRSGSQNEAIPVRFPQVYPLYGAVDIRNSSVERHKAVQQDLSRQIAAVDAIFSLPEFPSNGSRPEKLRDENFDCQHKLVAGLLPDDEQTVSLLLTDEVNTYFRYLLLHQPLLEAPIQAYFAQTDPATGLFNLALKRYERSMDWLNAAVNEYIDEEEKKLQTIYPHYFERYRTDGTEYSIYLGQSIAPDMPFTPGIRLRLLQWQLTSMVEVARLTHLLLSSLPLPLQTTQLILAYAQPVDIGFRQDERRFDVEGSYSIRYEVLKKRIDKAYIEGTQERLTQPNTIAIVYSHLSEVTDYLPFIADMQARGELQPDLEYLDIEPLQGVLHLKALRVRINYTDSAKL